MKSHKSLKKYVLSMLIMTAAYMLMAFVSYDSEIEKSYASSIDYYSIKVGSEVVANVETLEDSERVVSGVNSYYVEPGCTFVRSSVDPAVYVEKMSYDPQTDRAPVISDDLDSIVEEIITSYVTVTTEQDVTSEKTIPFETTYVDSSDMYTDESKVTTEGADGKKLATDRVVTVDGEKVSSTEISSEVIEEPVNKVVTRGTATRPASSVSSGYFSWPCSGSITSYFGYREDVPQYGYDHTGIDIAVPEGTPIYAAADGTVESSTGWSNSYGYVVFIDHGNGFETIYGHNSSLAVSPGQTVKKGQVIAYAGATGKATGTHCHFEVILNGVYQNPLNYL